LILHSFDYPPTHGGISRLCAEVATGLDRRGAGVRVLAQVAEGSGGSSIPEVLEDRVTSRRPWREWQALRHLLRSRSLRTPVLCGIWYPEGLLATLAGSRPRVIMAHGSELMPPRSRWRRGVWRRLQRYVLGSADLVLANSEYTLGLVRASAPGSRAVAVPLAVDHRRFCPGDRDAAKARFDVAGRLVVSSVSRIQAYKGHETVFRAMAALPSPLRERFIYLVAGRGPDVDLLRAKAEEHGVTDLVRWLGYVAEDDLPELYRATDLFALCTREVPEFQEVEGFGLVFLEAQACGTPVVGTRTGGIPDAITHHDGGWLIEPDDDLGLSGILLELGECPESFRLAGVAARRRVEREWTWDHYLRRLQAALNAEGVDLA
jgi:phosphatidylinositol alpha-1,6-mannosyltransferase